MIVASLRCPASSIQPAARDPKPRSCCRTFLRSSQSILDLKDNWTAHSRHLAVVACSAASEPDVGSSKKGVVPTDGSSSPSSSSGNSLSNIEEELRPLAESEILPLEAQIEASKRRSSGTSAASSADLADAASLARSGASSFSYLPSERDQIRESWDTLMRWSKAFRKVHERGDALDTIGITNKVVVFGGGSFGTAMAASLAHQKDNLEVVMLLRDPKLCEDINVLHCNTRYLPEFKLPTNMTATTNATEALQGAQFAVHAVPVQASRVFLKSIKDLLPPTIPIICVSKGLEVGSGSTMAEVIPSALGRKQPAVFISGPSFAREVMENKPTAVVAACKDRQLAKTVQELFASPIMRVNTTGDVVGVEICGALKNVLAIAAGIVEGLGLGNNSMAALISQGCSEIRWLAEKMGARPTTISGLSGLGDIMLTCYGSLSRNRTVGIRLGKGEKLAEIVGSTSQVAEGVATAGVVVGLARKYRVSLPVLTAVAQVLDNNITPMEAVTAIMDLPQIEEH